MDITFSCAKCGQHIAIDEAGVGQLVDCPKCGKSTIVPQKPEIHNTDIQFACCECGTSITQREELAGKMAPCPACGKAVLVPKPRSLAAEVQISMSRFRNYWIQSAETIGADAKTAGFGQHLQGIHVDHAASQTEQSGASTVSDCTIATVLTVVGVLDFVGAVVGGLTLGSENAQLGWIIFFSGIISGVFVLGFAYALRYLHAIAHRLKNIESIQSKIAK
jgi:DNA-directed RNA polymerase subunit RPC12/RpoP